MDGMTDFFLAWYRILPLSLNHKILSSLGPGPGHCPRLVSKAGLNSRLEGQELKL